MISNDNYEKTEFALDNSLMSNVTLQAASRDHQQGNYRFVRVDNTDFA